MKRFVDLLPHEQFKYLQDKQFGVDKLYFQAKDDLIRLTIIKKSSNIDLARRLYANTKYPKVRAALKSLLAQPVTDMYKEANSNVNQEKISAIIKQIIPQGVTLTDEEMKEWAQKAEELNRHDPTVNNFIRRIIEHMVRKTDADFPVSYYFKILTDAFARDLALNKRKIVLPKWESKNT